MEERTLERLNTPQKFAANAHAYFSEWKPVSNATKKLTEDLLLYSRGEGPDPMERARQFLFNNPNLGQDYVRIIQIMKGDDVEGHLKAAFDYMLAADPTWLERCEKLVSI